MSDRMEKREYPPLDILLRIRRHYGVSTADAERIFKAKGYTAVPERGEGRKTGRARQ